MFFLSNDLWNEQSWRFAISTIRDREHCLALHCRCLCGSITTKGRQWDERKPIITPNLPRRGPRWSERPRKLYSLFVLEDRFRKEEYYCDLFFVDFNNTLHIHMHMLSIGSACACRLWRTTSSRCCCNKWRRGKQISTFICSSSVGINSLVERSLAP